MAKFRPHASNVDGPFYVADGCCTACGVPESVAPELFAWDDQYHCFVKRQPSGASETYAMLRAVRTAELECIRYRGKDPEILARFPELGAPHLCDRRPLFFRPRPILRSQVTFTLNAGLQLTSEGIAAWFCDDFTEASPGHRVSAIESTGECVTFSIAWYEDDFHPVSLCPDGHQTQWLATHQGHLAVSDFLHEWLVQHASDIRWFASTDLKRQKAWRSSPW